MGEYGANATQVKAGFIWLQPSVAARSPFGGGDGLGGYMPLAVATPDTSGTIQLTWLHGDHLGVPLLITDASGGASTTPDDYLAPGFPGQSRVFADLYYNRYRDYDPVTGRYIQADPIGLAAGANSYGYVGGNPVNWIDPLGLDRLYTVYTWDTRSKSDVGHTILAEHNSKDAILSSYPVGLVGKIDPQRHPQTFKSYDEVVKANGKPNYTMHVLVPDEGALLAAVKNLNSRPYWARWPHGDPDETNCVYSVWAALRAGGLDADDRGSSMGSHPWFPRNFAFTLSQNLIKRTDGVYVNANSTYANSSKPLPVNLPYTHPNFGKPNGK